MYKISYMATRMIAEATSGIRENFHPFAYLEIYPSNSAECSSTPFTKRVIYAACLALGASAYSESSPASSAKASGVRRSFKSSSTVLSVKLSS